MAKYFELTLDGEPVVLSEMQLLNQLPPSMIERGKQLAVQLKQKGILEGSGRARPGVDTR